MLRHLRTTMDVGANLLLVIAASALLWRLYQTPGSPQDRAAGPLVEDIKGPTLSASYTRHAQGAGRVVLIEFSDFECPFCARHAQTTAPKIKELFVDSRRIQHVFLNFPMEFHRNAQVAAEAAECAALQGKFWQMHERLYAQQQALRKTDLMLAAQTLELDATAFGECLNTGETKDKVMRDAEEGRRLGVSGTPAFLLGIRRKDGSIDLMKRLNGALPFERFEETINEVLSRAETQKETRSS